MRMRARFSLVLGVLLALCPHSAGAAWTNARHDPQRTASATGTSDIKSPAPFWRYYLGGALAGPGFLSADLDGDGALDALYVRGARVHGAKLDGTTLWSSGLIGATQLVAVADFDGDGSLDVLGHSASRAFVLSANTGTLEWWQPESDLGALAALRVGDFDGDKKPDILVQECACCGTSNKETGFVYSFGAGFSAPKLLWKLPFVSCAGDRGTTVLDADGDGKLEISLTSQKAISLLDAATGAVKATSGDLSNQFATSYCSATPSPDGPGEWVICLTSFPGVVPSGHRLTAFRLSGSTLETIWSKDIGEVDAAATFVPNFIADIDGDGSREVVAGGESAGKLRVTQVHDLKTGELLTAIPNAVPTAVVSASGGKRGFLVTEYLGTIKGWTFTRSATPREKTAWVLASESVAYAIEPARRRTTSVASLPLMSDLDGDGTLELITMPFTGAGRIAAWTATADAAKELAKFVLPPGTVVTAVWLAPSTSGPERLFVARNDGVLSSLDAKLVATNDDKGGIRFGGFYAPGGWPALTSSPIVGSLGAGPESVLMGDSRGRLLRLDASKASIASQPKLLWARDVTAGPAIVPALTAGKPGIVCRSVRTPITQPPVHMVVALDADGKQLWVKATDNLVFGDVLPLKRSDGSLDVVAQTGRSNDLYLSTSAFSALDGSLRWTSAPVLPGAGRQPAGYAVSDWDADGTQDVIYQASATRVLSGATGAEIGSAGATDSYFLPTVYDVDGDGVAELTLSGGFNGTRTYKHDLTTLIWKNPDEDKPFPFAAVAKCPDAPVLVEGSWFIRSRLKITIMAGPKAGESKTMILASGASYATEADAKAASARMGQLSHITVHSNIRGTGEPTALVGSPDGFLYGVDPCTAKLAFTYDFRAPVGESVFGDTDGDGKDEIIVSVGDGYLYGIKNAVVSAPTNVIDTNPGGGVVDTDIDVLPVGTTTMSAKWDAVAGAAKYEVAVVGPDGSYLSSPAWIDVGSKTAATVDKLILGAGQHYVFSVRAVGATGIAGPDTPSDGVDITGSAVPDAGTDGGSDAAPGVDSGETDSGFLPLPDATVGDAGADAIEGGGCGCRTAGGEAGAFPLRAGLLALLAAGFARRRISRSRA